MCICKGLIQTSLQEPFVNSILALKRDLALRPAFTFSWQQCFLLLHCVGGHSVLSSDNHHPLPLHRHGQLCLCILYSLFITHYSIPSMISMSPRLNVLAGRFSLVESHVPLNRVSTSLCKPSILEILIHCMQRVHLLTLIQTSPQKSLCKSYDCIEARSGVTSCMHFSEQRSFSPSSCVDGHSDLWSDNSHLPLRFHRQSHISQYLRW